MAMLKDLLQEIRLIGLPAALFRAKQIFFKKTGLDAKLHPIRPFPTDDFLTAWKKNKPAFFCTRVPDIGPRDKTVASDAARGKIMAFRGWGANFGHPVNWLLNPTNGKEWPANAHSFRILNAKTKRETGDIKNTWEIGRFLHIIDILRAHDPRLTGDLLDQIADFEKHNPPWTGPHWMSEQEVAIRGLMFTLLLYAREHSDDHTSLLLRQIAACADYCAKEIDFARICINNNHLIAGALCLYVSGIILSKNDWRAQGRGLLFHALATQWHADGGYIQPSHNYHRLALDYLLWALRMAQIHADRDLANAILARLEKSFYFLHPMMDEASGQLPNWGPNDGALFNAWTDCDYADFRPLLNSLRYAFSHSRAFEHGPWDEALVWLWGTETMMSHAIINAPPEEAHFPDAGLHVFRDERSIAVFRAGPVLSRFGQQADQLHIDFWWKGQNVLRDAGSYCYADEKAHEWFRSTSAHNTVEVAEQSQMRPHRQFLFLDWPQVQALPLPPKPQGVLVWMAMVHDGYKRLPQNILHARLFAKLQNGIFLVADRLLSRKPDHAVNAVLSWHLGEGRTVGDGNWLALGDFGLCWWAPPGTTLEIEKSWLSRYYGLKKETDCVSLTSSFAHETLFVTCFGDRDRLPKKIDVTPETGEVTLDGLTLHLPENFMRISHVFDDRT